MIYFRTDGHFTQYAKTQHTQATKLLGDASEDDQAFEFPLPHYLTLVSSLTKKALDIKTSLDR